MKENKMKKLLLISILTVSCSSQSPLGPSTSILETEVIVPTTFNAVEFTDDSSVDNLIPVPLPVIEVPVVDEPSFMEEPETKPPSPCPDNPLCGVPVEITCPAPYVPVLRDKIYCELPVPVFTCPAGSHIILTDRGLECEDGE